LEILLSEVLEDPKNNETGYLEKRVAELGALDLSELLNLGKKARAQNAAEDEKEVEEIKDKYKVE
jgi:hypothetical protein